MMNEVEQGAVAESEWVEFVLGDPGPAPLEEPLEVPDWMRCRQCGGPMMGGLAPCEDGSGQWEAIWVCEACDG